MAQELADIVENQDKASSSALKALRSLDKWNFRVFDCGEVGYEVVDRIAGKIRRSGLIPLEEVHDSRILAEAAVFGAQLLISSDKHLAEAPKAELLLLLHENGLERTLVISPRQVLAKFASGRRRG